MPKSRNRKNHKRAALSFKKRVEDRKKAFEKQMRTMYEQQQQKMLDKQIQDGAVSPDQVEGGINVGDFKLDETPSIPETSNFGIVEGVTQPPQQ
jgi:hypothetical protein